MERIEPSMPKLFGLRGSSAWPYHTSETRRGVSHGLAMMLSHGPCADVTRCRLNISFIDKDGEKYDFQVSEGDNLLDIAQANDLEMEGSDPLGTGHNAQACLLTGFLCARSLRRFMRLLDMPCHCGGPRHVRQDGRTIRRRKRHAGFGIRADRDISVGLSSYHEQGA